jgi:hypothetical protein
MWNINNFASETKYIYLIVIYFHCAIRNSFIWGKKSVNTYEKGKKVVVRLIAFWQSLSSRFTNESPIKCQKGIALKMPGNWNFIHLVRYLRENYIEKTVFLWFLTVRGGREGGRKGERERGRERKRIDSTCSTWFTWFSFWETDLEQMLVKSSWGKSGPHSVSMGRTKRKWKALDQVFPSMEFKSISFILSSLLSHLGSNFLA